MKAIVHDAYGNADVLTSADIDTPRVGARDVLIAVRAAGMDKGTWHLMTGRPYLVRLVGPRRPRNRVPGLDVAGIVREVGPEVTRFAVGDEVFGAARGSFAEFAVAREDKLAHKPKALSFEAAGVLAVSGTTAYQAVIESGHVESGQRVLVVGASGGVGTFAVQLAAWLGADVTAVCSPQKADLVLSLGATTVLDYRTDDYLADAARYDVIIDIAGGSKIARLRRALKPTGTLVLVGNETGGSLTGGLERQMGAAAMSPFVKQRIIMLPSVVTSARLEPLARLADEGAFTPAIDRVVSLQQATDAMRLLERGEVRGKIALTVG